MAAKNPITSLNELKIPNKTAPPAYEFEEIDGKFKCTVRVNGKSATGISTTKKLAKQESARVMLQKLNATKQPEKKPATKAKQTLPTQKQGQTASTQAGNYVGELNSYSFKQKISCPVYECWPTVSKFGDLYVSCTFMEFQAIGKGKNKKEAKQNAAKNMLELYLKDDIIKSEESAKTSSEQKRQVGETDVITSRNIEEVVAKINNLAVNKQAKKNGKEPSQIQIVINLQN